MDPLTFGVIIRMQDPLKQGLKQTSRETCPVVAKNSNARSTKTRIETHRQLTADYGNCWIRMQDPLKQGLKQQIQTVAVTTNPIRMQDPLKQGLKLSSAPTLPDSLIIRMQDPLKQGLKLNLPALAGSNDPHSNARSTKTRIETKYYQWIYFQ